MKQRHANYLFMQTLEDLQDYHNVRMLDYDHELDAIRSEMFVIQQRRDADIRQYEISRLRFEQEQRLHPA